MEMQVLAQGSFRAGKKSGVLSWVPRHPLQKEVPRVEKVLESAKKKLHMIIFWNIRFMLYEIQ